jgi:predicted RNA-binding Zn-ribbon protein involved in translation (DUF1610 family)
MDVIVLLILMAVSLLIYFIPYIVAKQNKKQNAGAIGALNFFLGWTLVGWVVALVWAMSKDVIVQQSAPPVMATASASPVAISAQKNCPDCAELILIEAKKCRFCGHDFSHAILLGQ